MVIIVYSKSLFNIKLRHNLKLKNHCMVHVFVCLFDLILYVPSTIFQLNREGSSLVEPVLS